MLLNKTKALALISGLALSGLVSACSNNQAAQSSAAAGESSAVESTVQTVAESMESTPALPAEENDIGAEKAQEIALEKAGVKAEDTMFINAHIDRDDGKVVYDVEFQSASIDYEVTVDAVTGEVIEFSSENIDD
jgi:uncharacterized protein spy1430